MKTGLNHIVSASSPVVFLTSIPIMVGFVLYGINTVMLIFALRDGELSILYPVIALTYVWVMILSMLFFREPLNFFKAAGVLSIVAGVAVLGKSTKE